jgi:hypothetical protein
MAQYSFNPNAFAIGNNPIGNGWTQKGAHSPHTSAIAEVTNPIGGTRVWSYTSTAADLTFISLGLDAVPEATGDCEVLMLARFSGGTVLPAIGVMSRITTPLSGYSKRIDGATDAVSARLDNKNPFVSVEATAHGLTYASGSWFWIKLRSIGSNHRARFWAYEVLEPYTFLFDRTDSTHQNGGCGTLDRLSVNSGANQVAWFSVGTAGDTAPLPPGMASEADLYAHWKLDETSGTSAADSSLNTNTLTTTDVVWDDDAAWFNGTSSRADCPHHASLVIGDEYTLSAVIHPTAVGQSSSSVICGKGEGAGVDGGFRWNSSRTIRCDLFPTGGAVTTTATLPLNETSVVTTTWNRLASGDNRKIYFNGTEVWTGRFTTALTSTENSSHRFVVGSPFTEESRANRRFQGGIRNVRFYKRALPAAEVSALATYELSDQASLHPAIVYYLNLLRA